MPAAEDSIGHPATIKRQYYAIEMLRFISAFSIVIFHYKHFFVIGYYDNSNVSWIIPYFPFQSLFGWLYKNGGAAVQVFWVISGFIFYSKYSVPISEKVVSLWQFFIFRLSRLYPLHLVTLGFVATLQLIYLIQHKTTFVYGNNNLSHFMVQLVFASSWFSGQSDLSFDGPVWSVSSEILVYFFFFLVMMLKKPSIKRTTLIIVLAKALLHIQYLSVLDCALYFFYGGLVEIVISRSSKRMNFLMVLISTIVLCCVFLVLASGHIFSSVISQFFSIAVVFVFVSFDTLEVANFSSCKWLGNLTYSSYLLHFPIQLGLVILVDALGVSRNLFLSPIVLISFLFGTFSASYLSYRYFELPIQTYLRQKILVGHGTSNGSRTS